MLSDGFSRFFNNNLFPNGAHYWHLFSLVMEGRAFVSSGLAVEEEDTLERTLEKHAYLGVFN